MAVGLLIGAGLFLFGAGCPTVENQPKQAIEAESVVEGVNEGTPEDIARDKAMMENTKEEGVMKKEDVKKEEVTQKETVMEKTGAYEVYSEEKLSYAKDGKVVIFFKAPWCPTCRSVDSDIKANLASIPAGTHVLEIDYDSSTALKARYGVTYQHTFVQVDASGNLIKKWSGSPTLLAILREVQ